MANTQNPAKDIIAEILQNDLDSYFAKFSRVMNELSMSASVKFDEIMDSERLLSFKNDIAKRSNQIFNGFEYESKR